MSEVLLSELERSSRIDAEFYAKENLAFLSKLEKFTIQSITNFVRVSDGNHMSISKSFSEMGIPYYRGQDIHHNFIENSSPICINEATYSLPVMSRSHLKKGDILLSIVGTIGGLSLVTTNNKATCSCKLAILRPKKGVNPNTIFIFLKSKYGQNQIKKFTRGAVQMGLILEDMDQIKIPNFSIALQNKIEALVSSSFEKLQKSKEAYQTAQNLLLEHLGLKGFNPPVQAVNVKSFSDSFGRTGRLDAEFYQEKYEKLIDKIKSYPKRYNTLDYFIKDFSTGFAYKSETYTETGIPLIRINNIGNGTLDISNAMLIPQGDISLSPKDVANENDILISMSGTIGNSCKVPKGVNAVVNQRIMRISPQNINVEVLPLIINSIIGKYQLERMGTGGVQTNISANDIKQIVIPNVEEKIQTQIADLIRQSNYLRIKSKGLLEKAKKAVELAIEKDQESALDFIKGKQTNDCNVH